MASTPSIILGCLFRDTQQCLFKINNRCSAFDCVHKSELRWNDEQRTRERITESYDCRYQQSNNLSYIRRSIYSRGNCEQLIWFIVIFVRTSFSINNKRFFVILFRGRTIYRRDHHDAPKIWFHLFSRTVSSQVFGVGVNKTWIRLALELHFIVSRLELQIGVSENPDRLKVESARPLESRPPLGGWENMRDEREKFLLTSSLADGE